MAWKDVSELVQTGVLLVAGREILEFAKKEIVDLTKTLTSEQTKK